MTEPLQKDSRRSSERLMTGTRLYHAVIEGSRWILCGCMKQSADTPFGQLRRNARKYRRWAQ